MLSSLDAFDFFSVSLTVTDLATTFNKSNTQITWGITLVLMFRSLGSAIFGIAADRYGRKWPFIINNVLFIILELVCISRALVRPGSSSSWILVALFCLAPCSQLGGDFSSAVSGYAIEFAGRGLLGSRLQATAGAWLTGPIAGGCSGQAQDNIKWQTHFGKGMGFGTTG